MALKEERLFKTKGHFLESACCLELFEYYAESFQCIKAVFVENYFPRRHLEEKAAVFSLQDVIFESKAKKTLGLGMIG